MSEKTIIEQANLTELQATISARQIKRLGKYTHWILLPPIVCVGTAVIFFCLLSRIKMQNFGVPTITPEKNEAILHFSKSILFIIPTLCVKIICILATITSNCYIWKSMNNITMCPSHRLKIGLI